MYIDHLSASRNHNGGIVPPWLLPPANTPHTWAELEAVLNAHDFIESRSNENHTINETETTNDNTAPTSRAQRSPANASRRASGEQ